MNRVVFEKVAIVTGAGKRLGRQIVLALGSHGFKVLLVYHTSGDGARSAAKLIRQRGGSAETVRVDISLRREVQDMLRKAVRTFGRVDLLVNNSAIFTSVPFDKISDALWDKTLDTNLKGTFLCSQIVASQMKKQGGGQIINIASLGGIQSWREHTPYSVSKAGVIMLTRCMAKALAPDILVNAIAPGTIIIRGEEDASQRHVPVSTIPLKGYGQPSDITDLVLFLANTNRYITGQVFSVDGGRSA